VTNWQPGAELLRLLEAFADEIANATDAEVHATTATSAAAARATMESLFRMREVIASAVDEPSELRDKLPFPDLAAISELRQRPN
jgi:hypothetical protein